jgi:hypothetical protein
MAQSLSFILVDNYSLNNYTEEDGLYQRLYFDEPTYQPLIDRLYKQILKHIVSLTKRQQQILNMWMEGMTLVDISKQLGINPASVHNCLFGKNKHGGVFRVLRKKTLNDGIMALLLNQIKNAKMDDDNE